MIAMKLQFPAGRFHATPWGRHVNESAPEWPPSPWRILRTFVATWKNKLDGEVATKDVQELLQRLAAPPVFYLPPASLAHTRHFMPLRKGAQDRTLVFDAFVAIERETFLVVAWPELTLADEQRLTLSRLLQNVSFLGRAESWCDATLLKDDQMGTELINCEPIDKRANQAEYEIVKVLCVDPDSAFQNDHVSGRGYDPEWNMCVETAQLHKERWSDPPGAVWVQYARSRGCFKIEPRRRVQMLNKARPQIARFALDSAVLPPATETLPTAENARRTLMGIFGRLTASAEGVKGKSTTFSGKDSEGRPGTEHGHAYYIPSDEDGDGKLDHLTVFSSDGFTPTEVRALDRLTELKSREREAMGHPLIAVLLGLGRLDDYFPPPLKPSKVWVSASPFLVTRHLKTRGTKRDSAELQNDPKRFIACVAKEELKRWLSRQPNCKDIDAEDIEITPVLDEQGTFRIGKRQIRPIQFRRFRQKRGDDGGRRPSGAFTLRFPHEVSGPICLGHSSHFGMGLFLPVESGSRANANILPSLL